MRRRANGTVWVQVLTISLGTLAVVWVRSSYVAGACLAGLGARSYLRPCIRNLRSSVTSAARGGDAEARSPPEPRARGPRTERDVANDVVFGVVAVDLLYNHDRLDLEVGNAFRRSVYDPALKRLRFYADSNTSEARSPAKSWRLQDRTLEKQFSLSCYYTDVATSDLQMSRVQDPLLPAMQLTSRDILCDIGVKATDDPVSSALIAWTAHCFRVGDGPGAEWQRCRGRPWGYAVGKPDVSEWLLPVFVEHDRSSHAERMALLAFGELVKSAGGKLHPDSPVSGAASVYASHTPCISCMAVFCQFKRRLPGVKLHVCFDKWGETNRWIAEYSRPDPEVEDEEE
eukprot:TRINITY_DN15211_c1_g2_i1.p1 TRINITY_DN15211_c1_g2~~TRINITY_DN15211_c1_g2_i1.p1  ORF type:complete len:359 (+),score=40.12 TRINITY_DN15211_c1_g2_i1:50-1078(+)